jgi:hypothetical protein
LLLALTCWQGILFIRKVAEDTRHNLDTRVEALEELQDLEQLVIENLDRPILADEYMGMITLNGRDLFLQPFEITQLSIGGLFDQHVLIEKIKQEQFSLILLQEDSWWVYALEERWTPEMLEAIRDNYRLAGQFESTFAYKPRTSRQAQTPVDCPKAAWPLPTSVYMGYRYDNGWLSLYGAGPEGTVPVEAVATGKVYRLEQYPEGSLAVIHDDPLRPGEKIILFYTKMRSSQNGNALIPESIPTGSNGLPVEAGQTIGYQSMWAGRANQQDWLHVMLGMAPYTPQLLENPDLLEENLINPGDYFGVQIDVDARHLKPIICLD